MRTLKPALTTEKRHWSPRALLVIMAVILMFSAPMMSAAQTLSGSDFVTETGDHTMAWNDNWSASLIAEDDFSTMVMLDGQISIYAIMFIHDEDLNLSMSAVYHSLSGVLINQFDAPPTHSIEWEEGDGSFRGAHILQLSGIDFVLYLRVDPAIEGTGPTMQFAAAPLQAFPVSLEAMQEELTVDGGPVFSGDDGADVAARLEDTTIEADSDSAAPLDATESREESAPGPTMANDENPLDDRSRLNRGAAISNEQSSDGTYVSSANEFTVTYPDSWTDMAETDATIGEFSLLSDSGRSVVSFTGRSTTETNRQAFFEDIVARESRYSGYVGSVVTEDRLLIATWTEENELAVLEYVFLNDSTVVTIMVTITSGNPDLKPSYSHSGNVRFRMGDWRAGRMLFGFGNVTYNASPIGTAAILAPRDTVVANGVNLQQGAQYSYPVNLESGSLDARTFLVLGSPLPILKSNLNIRSGVSYARRPGLVNGVLNKSNQYGVNAGLTLASNISERLDFTLTYGADFTTASNTFYTEADEQYLRHNAGVRFTWLPIGGLVLEADARFNDYVGLDETLYPSTFILNAGIGYKFLRQDAAEVKLVLGDILNQETGINRSITEMYIQDSQTQVLGRYVLLNLSYRLRNFGM